MKYLLHEGMKIGRLFMVMSSISPLFILWAIRGNGFIADRYFLFFCLLMVLIPNMFLLLRVGTAKKLVEKRELIVGSAEDHRDHLLVYLFAILLPFYAVEINTWRDFAAIIVTLSFIIFLFWHLNLHYLNLIFALRGYRIFTVYPPRDNNPYSGKHVYVLITHRVILCSGQKLNVLRLSDTVYLEEEL